jgi:hypothetical protein
MGVMINNANVTTADVTADNGVVHVIDAVLLPAPSSVEENFLSALNVFPNPTQDFINLNYTLSQNSSLTIEIVNLNGQLVKRMAFGNLQNGFHTQLIDISELASGIYQLNLVNNQNVVSQKLVKH